MFGNYKTLRRLKMDYSNFEINGSLGSEIDIKKDKPESRRFLRPALRFSTCAVAAVAIILVGTLSPSLLRNFGASGAASSGKSEISHDFAFTAYAVNNITNKKTAIDFNVNMKQGISEKFFVRTFGHYGFATIDFTNLLAKNMNSITYTSKNALIHYIVPSDPSLTGSFKDSNTFTVKKDIENSYLWLEPPTKDVIKLDKLHTIISDFSKFEGDVITVTAKFKDGQTATKVITIKFTKDGRLLTKVVNK